jgi:hypothetical protein
MKTSLFALKTDLGYGLLHWYENYVFGCAYLIYHIQISDLSEFNINTALTGDCFYQRINDKILRLEKHMEETLKKNIGVEFDLEKLDNRGIISTHIYAHCFMTYLGEYELPAGYSRPPYSKRLYINYYTGKRTWVICDTLTEKDIYENGKIKLYNKQTPDMLDYPSARYANLAELYARFNKNFRLRDYNDDYADYLIEKRYQEEPNLRSTKEKYDDVKSPLPTVRWREFEDVDDDYLKFCDAVECALDEFITSIDANCKAVSKPLCALLTMLNKISAVHPFESLEQEELYDYIVKILQTLKKAQLIDRIDNIREW